MKNWKKYALASASVIALGATLAACGSLTGNNKKSATTEDGKPIIKMYQIGDKPDNLDVLLKNANKIIEKKVGAKLDIQYLGWGDYAQKMNVIISSGENYDIAFANNYVINAQKGAYADLTELYKKEGKDLYKALDPAYIKGNTVNGKIYAVPVAANVASSQNFAFNGPLLEKYGIDVSNVTDYASLEPVLKAIKEKDPNGNGEADEIPLYLANGALSQLLPYYGIGFDGNTNATYNGEQMEYYPTSEKYKEFLKMARGLSEEGLINNYVLGTWDEQAALGTTQDVLGSLLQWGAYLSVGAEKDEDWPTVVPFENTMVPSLGIQFGGLVLTDKCEHPELILQWADYFYSTEGSDLGWLGVDGESYQRNDDGTYTWLTDGAWGADMAEIRDNATLFGDKPWPGLSSKFFDEGQTNPEEKYLYGQREIVKEHFTERFPKLSYTEDELKRKATYEADINPYISQYEAQVISGEVDLDSTWDEYVATLNNMGLQDLISINQAAVSRFYAE